MKELLIIEDNDMMSMFLANYFTNDYSITLSRDHEEALSYFKDENASFDLIISDFKNQSEDEFEILKDLSSKAKIKNTPLVILTDEDYTSERLIAFEIGARDTLSKPFNPVELNLRITAILNQTTRIQQLQNVA